MRSPLVPLLLLLAPPAATQAVTADEMVGTTLVTALRAERDDFDTPHAAAVVGALDIERRSYRTTPQALRDLPGVMVQETAHGQGSPYLRGFTGFRTLFLVDGIRLNNSVFRDGPNQYTSTVDPLSLDRLEVVLGPGSVLWGSDAIGGTVNAVTRLPYSYGRGVAGRAYYRVSSAESSHIGRLEVSGSIDDKVGVLFGASGKTLGDLHGGDDVGTQRNTGYDEWGADLKVEIFPDDDTRVVFAHQSVRQNDVPRTHRTVSAESFEGTTVGTDLRRDLDQRRRLTYVQIHAEDQPAFFDRASASVSWHHQEEERDRIRGSGARELQGFEVGAFGLSANLSSPTPIGRLTYGVEYYRDDVDSFLDRGAAQTPADDIQGPVGDDASYDLAGLFVQDEILATDRLDLILGARFDWARANADSVRDPVTSTRISVDDEWSSLVGSARFVYRMNETANLYGGVSQGFRAPNLSDLTRFDTARTNEFEIPSPDLDPEHTTTLELGVKLEGGRTSGRAAVFWTDVRDMIVRFPTGNTNAAGEFEITKDNVGDGRVWGIELSAERELTERTSLFGHGTFLDGEVTTFPTSAPVVATEPIDRQMPITLGLGLRFEDEPSGFWGEVAGVWADDADELSTRDIADTERIPPGGTPGYAVGHVRGGCRLSERVSIVAALENVFDEDYRVHGSGQNMAGRNVVVSLTAEL